MRADVKFAYCLTSSCIEDQVVTNCIEYFLKVHMNEGFFLHIEHIEVDDRTYYAFLHIV